MTRSSYRRNTFHVSTSYTQVLCDQTNYLFSQLGILPEKIKQPVTEAGCLLPFSSSRGFTLRLLLRSYRCLEQPCQLFVHYRAPPS